MLGSDPRICGRTHLVDLVAFFLRHRMLESSPSMTVGSNFEHVRPAITDHKLSNRRFAPHRAMQRIGHEQQPGLPRGAGGFVPDLGLGIVQL